ncbi:hypothetical protein L6452_25862 [Arctium lappa]|uniref:Uncharacterized protein n=1 Tax=Arctium lappa TaxID=4217 RepID=A0ACB9ACN8_ARCLA|nr:hypothetical protein L6452_25862 [Arctium lappa]
MNLMKALLHYLDIRTGLAGVTNYVHSYDIVAKKWTSKCGLCDTYNIAHVNNACAFLGDGMSRIENACNFLKIVCKPLCFSTHDFGGIWEVDFSDSTLWYRRLAPSSELIVYALITVLDSVSNIDMLGFLPDFLDGKGYYIRVNRLLLPLT